MSLVSWWGATFAHFLHPSLFHSLACELWEGIVQGRIALIYRTILWYPDFNKFLKRYKVLVFSISPLVPSSYAINSLSLNSNYRYFIVRRGFPLRVTSPLEHRNILANIWSGNTTINFLNNFSKKYFRKLSGNGFSFDRRTNTVGHILLGLIISN